MEQFGLLTFIEEAGVNKHGKKLWKLKCDCGEYTVAIASQVRSGKTKSCGHLKSAGNRRTHGQRNSKLYVAWCNMKARCDNKAHKFYKNYGGRGISYAPAWAVFENFAKDVGEPPSNKHTLDRINNNGNYCKENVRWADRHTQARNSRANIWVTIDGVKKCLYDWCAEYGVVPSTVYRRLAKGVSIEAAITFPTIGTSQKK
jgi:hypothetical protein